MDGQIDGQKHFILNTPNWTHCLHHGLYLWWFLLDPERQRWAQGIPSRPSHTVIYLYLYTKKELSSLQKNKKKIHSYFTKTGLPKVIPSIPLPLEVCQEEFLTHAISNIQKPTYACIQIRLARRKGGVGLRLPYHLLHLAGGTEKLVISIAAAPGANSTTTEPSLWNTSDQTQWSIIKSTAFAKPKGLNSEGAIL